MILPDPPFTLCTIFVAFIKYKSWILLRSSWVEKMEAKSELKLRCVECGFPIRTLYVQYSPGNIRLMRCENCKSAADEYIECEIMIIVIDLILHKSKAYRHLFFNMFNRDSLILKGLLWKSVLAYLFLDAYKAVVLMSSERQQFSARNSISLSWMIRKMLMRVVLGNFFLTCTLLFGARKLRKKTLGVIRYKEALLALLVSSYFKIFLTAMMVWEFPSLVIIIIDVFVLSSNTVALKVITESDMTSCFAVCFIAHMLKFITSQGFVFNFQI